MLRFGMSRTSLLSVCVSPLTRTQPSETTLKLDLRPGSFGKNGGRMVSVVTEADAVELETTRLLGLEGRPARDFLLRGLPALLTRTAGVV